MSIFFVIWLSMQQPTGMSAWEIERKGGQVRYEIIVKRQSPTLWNKRKKSAY